MDNLEGIFTLFILLSGFIIGHGAVTVIDLHGFLGQKSSYWTEATIRTHKITKPLIWIGMILLIIGFLLCYAKYGFPSFFTYQILVWIIMIINGIFLSFYISPFLLKLEKEGKSKEILPKSIQSKIFISFIISFISWWGNVLILSYYITNLI